MQTSLFLAKLLGPVLFVTGIGLLANRAGYQAMAKEFLKSRALIYLAGLLALIPGIALVLVHNVWAADWRVLITLFGWLAGDRRRIPHRVPGAGHEDRQGHDGEPATP